MFPNKKPVCLGRNVFATERTATIIKQSLAPQGAFYSIILSLKTEEYTGEREGV